MCACRDALLAALLDAAQTAAARPIPVLCQPTAAGEPIVSQRVQAVAAPAVAPGGEWLGGAPLCCLLSPQSEPWHSWAACLGGGSWMCTSCQQESTRCLLGLAWPKFAIPVSCPPRCPDAELEKLCLHQLNAAAKDFMAAGGGATSLAALALAGLSAASAAALAAGVGGAAPAAVDSEDASGSEAGSDAPGGGGGSPKAGPAGILAAGRGGFMQRAFARQPAAAAAGAGGRIEGGAATGGSSSGSTDVFAAFQQRVREFNACVPYAGLAAGEWGSGGRDAHTCWACVALPWQAHPVHPSLTSCRLPWAHDAGCKVDDVAILALLAHLPRQQAGGEQAGWPAGGSPGLAVFAQPCPCS